MTMAKRLLDLVIKRKGWKVATLTAEADPKEPKELRRLLVDAIKRDGRDESQIGDYEMEVSDRGNRSRLMIYVASS
jgi:integrase